MHGGKKKQPRLTYFCGDPPSGTHTYTNTTFKVNPWHPSIKAVAERIHKETGLKFNSALPNYYRHGKDGVSWHSDKEAKSLHRAVASVSLGASRDKHFRRTDDHTKVIKQTLNSGDALVMWGDTQNQWEHCIPKRGGTHPERIGERISITLRCLE